MKFNFGLLAVAVAVAVAVAGTLGIAQQADALPTTHPSWHFVQTFADEFKGTTELDTTKWNYNKLGARRDAINTKDAISVSKGKLKITTYTENGVHYTGMLSTRNKFEQEKGYFEARIKFSTQAGMWSAFWMMSPTVGDIIGDPANSGVEIDIVEHRARNKWVGDGNTDITDEYQAGLHWDGYGDDHQTVNSGSLEPSGLGNGSWHKYGVWWRGDEYRFYFDDQLMYTTNAAMSEVSEYFLLSSEVQDDSWAGYIPTGGYGTKANSNAWMLVDYVRAYSFEQINGSSVPEPDRQD